MDTFRIIKHHLECDLLPEKKTSIEDVKLACKDAEIVTYDDWLKIDEVERRRGSTLGKSREKVLSKEEMLKIKSN